MNNFGSTVAVIGGLTATVIACAAPAGAAPTGIGNAEQTVKEFESHGYTVILVHIGSSPLDQGRVVRVRSGQTYTRTDTGNPGDSRRTTIEDKTVYVEVE
jgi:hypothetical protein